MALISINWSPPVKQLRQFGLCGLVALPLLAWVLNGRTNPVGWHAGEWGMFWWLAWVGIVLGALGLFAPVILKPVFLGATLVTAPIGMVVSELLLVLIYFAVFTPVAFIFRVIGRDALHQQFRPEAQTYWVPRSQPASSLEYYRQS